jgi:hypothetical protein
MPLPTELKTPPVMNMYLAMHEYPNNRLQLSTGVNLTFLCPNLDKRAKQQRNTNNQKTKNEKCKASAALSKRYKQQPRAQKNQQCKAPKYADSVKFGTQNTTTQWGLL